MKSTTLILSKIFLASACSNASAEITPTLIAISTPTLQPTSTILPTETHQPTPTYLPITPALQGTQLPEHGGIITVENIDRLTLLSSLGKGNPTDVIYTADGKYLVISTSVGLYFYNPEDYSLIHFIDTQIAVAHIAVSPDSQTIAAVAKNEVLLYRVSDWQLLLSIKEDANSIDFSPDGKTMALGINPESQYLQFRDVKTGEVVDTFKNEQAVWAVKISPNGNIIATGGYSTTIWSPDGSILDQYGPYASGGQTESVSFSPNGKFLAEGAGSLLRIWRVLDNGRIVIFRKINLSQFNYPSIFSVSISPNGELVAASLLSGVGVWNLNTGQRIFFSAAKDAFTFYNSIAWSLDSKIIAAASNKTGVELWNISTEENIITLNNPSGTFSSLAWSPDGRKLLVGANEGVGYIFNTLNSIADKNFGSGYELNSVSFCLDCQMLALGYGNGIAKIWHEDGTLIQTIDGSDSGSSDVTFTMDGKLFAAILRENWQSPPQVRIWNTNDWSVEKVIAVGDKNNYRITGFALASNQNIGAISYVDMRGYHKEFIKIISIHDGTTLATLDPKRNQYRAFIDAIEYSPDNSMLAAFVSEFDDLNPRILVWQTNDWSLLYQITVTSGSRLGFNKHRRDTLTWSPNSHLLAVGVENGSIQVFKAMDGENLATFYGHTMAVTGVSFSPDGRILASISLDGILKLWGLQ